MKPDQPTQHTGSILILVVVYATKGMEWLPFFGYFAPVQDFVAACISAFALVILSVSGYGTGNIENCSGAEAAGNEVTSINLR